MNRHATWTPPLKFYIVISSGGTKGRPAGARAPAKLFFLKKYNK